MEQNRNNIFTKSDEEIIKILARWWKMSEDELMKPFKVIASFKKSDKKDKNDREYGYFIDVRNLNGDILYYPPKFGLVKIFSVYKEGFMSSDIWQINVKLAPRVQREKYKNPFLLVLDNAIVGKPKINFIDKLKKEKLIKHRFEQTGYTKIDAINTSNALVRLMGDLYTETERFVFELLQNADDQPEEGKLVNITLKSLDENLLFLHNGKPFNEADVESISSIGDSTKKNDIEKTGYKGIGFKSVFSVADTVYIDSGNFSFAFDKNSPLYPDGADMDKIPWQIKPIWEERYRLPKEVQKEDLYFKAPVGIALNVGGENIETYNESISQLLVNPRFTLFLRNVGEISFDCKGREEIKIGKQVTESGIVQITSNNITENWITKDYIIDIPAETSDAIQNEKLVPAKLKEATKTKITFAAKIEDGTICTISDAVLYTYLPTKVDEFGFKFLVNADFLTTASREQIHFKNIWNRFLFTQIGNLLLDWIKGLNEYKGALNLLPSQVEDTDNLLADDFFSSLKGSLLRTNFISGHKGDLLSVKDIMIDRSGLSQIIGKDLFCQIVNPLKSLPLNETDNEVLKESKLIENIESYTTLSVLETIINNQLFYNWFLDASEEKKAAFYSWIIEKNTEKRKPCIIRLIDSLPIYKFGDKYLSKKEATDSLNKIVVRNGHSSLVPIFESCNIECSENIDLFPISQFYSDNIVKSTYDYIFSHLQNNTYFSAWLFSASDDEIKILTDWMDKQDTTDKKHGILVDFVESLPIIVFKDKRCKKSDILKKIPKPVVEGNRIIDYKTVYQIDETRLIITNKLAPVAELLAKIGFLCSENIDNSPLIKYFNHLNELDVFKLIKDKASKTLCDNKNVLSHTEKLELFNALKELKGVDTLSLAQTLIFRNQADTHRRWLSTMTSYSSDVPVWMYEYTISKEENFSDLFPYLVRKERVFEDIVKERIEELIKIVSLKDIYTAYKDSWTLLFTKKLINNYGTTLSVLEMVEAQNNESKRYFLQQISKIDLDLAQVYSQSSFVFRILSLAFQVLSDDELRDFAGKIWIGERALTSFMVSDEISFEYHEGKSIRLPLIKLLPSYVDTGIVQKIKNALSNFNVSLLDRLLALKPMRTQDIWQKVDKANGLTPYTYLLGIYRTRKVHSWYAGWVPSVNLEEQSNSWISELLSIMYEQKIELYQDCFGYRLSSYFTGYISNDYVNEDEVILKAIENWADTDDKLSYIVGLGVKTERTNLVRCRKALINNEVLSSNDIDNIKEELTSTINLLKSKKLLPLQGGNQISAMLTLEPNSKYLTIHVDKEKLSINSVEYSLPEYLNWKQTDSISIYIYDGLMPCQLRQTNDNESLICSFERGDYYYDNNTKTLYVNKSSEVRDTLYALVSNMTIPFTAEDWQQLYYDNLVSKSEVESREQKIEELKNELKEYKKLYGSLPHKEENNKDVDNKQNPPKDSAEKTDKEKTNSGEDSKKKEKESPKIKKGEDPSLSKSKQYEAQIEAQRFLMQEEPSWHFPPHYGEYNEEEKPYYYSTVQLEDANENPISIVLKSYKKQDEPFKVNPEEWDSVVKDSAYLLIYTGDDIKRIKKEDLVRNQSNISLSFSTENLDIEERIDAFCSTLHYFKELHFDFSSFNIAENAESIKNIFNRNEGTQNSNSENDI